MDKSVDRVDRDAQESEEERKRRELEVIAEMSGVPAEESESEAKDK